MPEQYWAPHVTVAAVIEQAGRYLFVEEEVNGRRVLNQPAGHLETGESLQQAVIREVREETGHAFRPESLLAVYQWCSGTGDEFLRFVFSGGAWPESGQPEDPAILALHWLTSDELAASPLALRSPMVAQALRPAGQPAALDLLHRL